jgi:hypothetical protein
MTEVGYQWGIKALRKRRAENAGDIDQLKIQTRHRQRDLKRVDGILRVLAPGIDPTTIATKKPGKYLKACESGSGSGMPLPPLVAASHLAGEHKH